MTPTPPTKLEGFAQDLKMEVKPLLACYQSKETLERVRRDAAEAETLGLRSTPSFVINGRLVAGADVKGIKEAIEEVLRRKNAEK